MTDEELDGYIRQALLRAAEAEAAPLPGEEEPPVPLSLRKRLQPLLYDPLGTKLLEAGRHMGGAALTGGGSRAGAGALGRFLERHGLRKPRQSADPRAGWVPAWLPEGYGPAEAEAGGSWLRTAWAGPEGGRLTLSVGTADAPLEAAEDRRARNVEVNGGDGYWLPPGEPGGPAALIWFDEGSGLVFVLRGPLTEEELLRAARSVARRED